MKEKNSINLLKIIAILFVISMHVISKAISNYGVGTFSYKFLIFIDIILKTSVPLFVLISGNLVLNRNYGIKKIIIKIVKYYIFFIIFNSLYKVFDAIFINNIELDTNIIKSILVDSIKLQSIYQMWYFHIIFLTYAFSPILCYLINKNKKIIDILILVVLVLLFQVIPWFIPVFYRNYTYLLVFLTYFYLGYFLNKYSFKYENIILFVLFILSYIFTYNKTVNMDHDFYYFNFTFFNITFISIFIYNSIVSLDKYLKNERINNILKKLSKYNFSIFLLHGLVIGLLSKINIINIYQYDNLFKIISNTLIVYFSTLLITFVVKKVVKEL